MMLLGAAIPPGYMCHAYTFRTGARRGGLSNYGSTYSVNSEIGNNPRFNLGLC